MVVKTIYKIEPKITVHEQLGTCQAILEYENKLFIGNAWLSHKDIDFFSEKVGLNIALSRARIQLLKYVLNKAITNYNIRNQMYREVINNATSLTFTELYSVEDSVDPTGRFSKNVIQAEKNVKRIRDALKKEEKGLRFYIQSQDNFIKSIKKRRSQDNNN